jgi:hypothetical protein
VIDPLELADEIARLPADWHGAGSVSPGVLRRIAHAAAERPLRRSVETGSGRTTLLLSHLSAHHTVFAVDAGGSMSQVRNSPLFNAATTTFIEGPTQRTLPAHSFDGPHDLVLIDGPHGYPFPDLEYFYLYPTLSTGAWLIVDDIQIPTIARMFEILRADAMFALDEVIDGNTAFLRRTEAPAINPHSDSWWEQGYNRPYHQQLMGQTPEPRPTVTTPSAATPPTAATQPAATPESWWRRLRR